MAQPDFPLAVRSLETLTEQVSRCQNIPAIDGGLRLTQVLEEIRNGMRDMRNEVRAVNRKLDDLDRKVGGLDRRMTVAERNGVARMENSSAMRPDAGLAPLFSLETGDEIPGCPSTMEEVGSLAAREIDRILRQLGASTAGTKLAARTRD
ncbi:hypothetical protein G6O67_000899 [Ophiocordyceps sinensis]|uniref:Uncharacterized protein n=1 Tax=Ophiocordyceps sinensis TaxID=72228 RepID=A0A8H4Q034_9HYPO|nr:hypothetical protein G6O67_000899 [Ophiocordyceps sinensis]